MPIGKPVIKPTEFTEAERRRRGWYYDPDLGWQPPESVYEGLRRQPPSFTPSDITAWLPRPDIKGIKKGFKVFTGQEPIPFDPAAQRLAEPFAKPYRKVEESPVGKFLVEAAQLPIWSGAPAAGGALLGMAGKVPKKIPKVTPAENPYLKMPLARVKQDAEKGVKLAKEALESRKSEIVPEVKPTAKAELGAEGVTPPVEPTVGTGGLTQVEADYLNKIRGWEQFKAGKTIRQVAREEGGWLPGEVTVWEDRLTKRPGYVASPIEKLTKKIDRIDDQIDAIGEAIEVAEEAGRDTTILQNKLKVLEQQASNLDAQLVKLEEGITPPVEPSKGVKKPWLMTLDEYIASKAGRGSIEELEQAWHSQVQQAAQRGENVPKAILQQQEELARKVVIRPAPEAWEMSLQDWARQRQIPYETAYDKQIARKTHEGLIKEAIAEGKPVSAKVRAEAGMSVTPEGKVPASEKVTPEVTKGVATQVKLPSRTVAEIVETESGRIWKIRVRGEVAGELIDNFGQVTVFGGGQSFKVSNRAAGFRKLQQLASEQELGILRRKSPNLTAQERAILEGEQAIPKEAPPEPLPAAGVPPVQPPTGTVGATASIPPSKGSPLSKIQNALTPDPKKPFDWQDLYRKAQEYVNDQYNPLRTLQSKVSKTYPILPGSSLDVTTALTRAPGVPNIALARYQNAIDKMKNLAPNAKPIDINTIVNIEHGKEILAAKGPLRVLPGGVNTEAELNQALKELETRLGTQYQQTYKAAEVVKNLYATERQRLVDAGIFSQELGDTLAKQYPWYNPLKYADYAEAEMYAGRRVKPLSLSSTGLQRLSEVGSEGKIIPPLEALPQQLIRNAVRISKNELADGIIELGLKDPQLGLTRRNISIPVAQIEGKPIFRPQQGEIPGTISRFVNGKREVWNVPDWLYRETNTLNQTLANPVVSLIAGLNGISRAAFTSLSPVFTIANMANDILPAFIRGGITPVHTAEQLISSLQSFKTDKIGQAFKLSGAYQARFYGRDVAEIVKEVGASGGQVIGKGFNLKKAILNGIPKVGEWGEQGTRRAIFKNELDKTLPNWRNMEAEAIAASSEGKVAAAKSVEGTINFHRGAYAIRSANPFVIFLNASFEGTKLPFRALRESPRARWRLAGVMAGVAGLTAYNMSYPEYEDVPDRTRWGSVMIMLPSSKTDLQGKPIPKYLTIIPNTREWALFLAPIIAGLEHMGSNAPFEFGKFAQTLIPQLSPVSSLPLPPVLSEAAQQWANYDFYQGRPIVPQGKQNLLPTEQTGPYVSPTVEKAAQATGQSPLRVQHVLQALFGGAGAAVLSVLDLAVGAKNQHGLDLKAQYDSMLSGNRTSWFNNLSSADKSALTAATNQAGQTIPVVTSVVSRFYHERGGQLSQTEYTNLDTAYKTSAQKVSAFPDTKRLGVSLGKVGDTIAGAALSTKERTVYQVLVGSLAEKELSALTTSPAYQSLPDDKKKTAIQDSLDSARAQARDILAPQLSPVSYARYEIAKRGGSISQFEKQTGLKWDDPKAEKLITGSHKYLKAYWGIEEQVWGKLDPRYKELSDAIEELAQTNPTKAREYLFKYPQIVYARKEVLLRKRAMRAQSPTLEEILGLFY